MAIAVTLDIKGTLEQYDQVIRKMHRTPGGPGPSGELFHWVTATDDGFRVTNVWETKEQFEAFIRDTIIPLNAEVGITEPAKITFYDVHNYLTAGPTT